MEYTPNPAASKRTTATRAPAVTPSLCLFATSTAELLVGPEACAAGAGIVAATLANTLPDDDPDTAAPDDPGADTVCCAPDCGPLSCTVGTVVELDEGRWRESVSRFSRFRSARISAAP